MRSADTCDVAIVGAGPVGLLLGCLLAQRGSDVLVLEKRADAHTASRAIGVHPPGLACLHEVGVAEALIARGVRVRCGRVFSRGRCIAQVQFESLAPPFDFVLSVPQVETERLLTERLQRLAPHALRRGVELLELSPGPHAHELHLRDEAGPRTLRARFVVGCDGKHSVVRSALQITFRGGPYAQRFVMGDFADTTSFGPDAAVFFTDRGLVESFPLPGKLRRWVLGTGKLTLTPDATSLAAMITERTGLRVPARCALPSTFIAERYLAETFALRGVVLAGDAAHVVSPIGGQGMNLGWLSARALADTLTLALHDTERAAQLLSGYSRQRTRAARSAARRAELYMALGCPTGLLGLRSALTSTLLSRPFAAGAARLFTMRGLVT